MSGGFVAEVAERSVRTATGHDGAWVEVCRAAADGAGGGGGLHRGGIVARMVLVCA